METDINPAREHPRTLAALRISVCAVLLASPETYSATSIAALPPELRFPPEGLHWFFGWAPLTPAIAQVAEWLLLAALVSALIGFRARTSMALVTALGFYVLGASQLTGSVTHDMHLLWWSALLAAGPCGDAWSVDRWLASRRGDAPPGPSVDVSVTLTFCRALLGLVYFFPGFWKLRAAGIDWITSDNLRNQMLFKWYEHGVVGPFRIDRHAGLLRAGALGVVLLELSFPVLVFFRRTRVVAALGGFLFHALSQLLLFIPFPSLWLNYTMLFDWGPRGAVASAPTAMSRRVVLQCILGAALVLSVFVQGARNAVQAWPFACYPTFQHLSGDTIPDLVLEAIDADGSKHVLPGGGAGPGLRTQAEWGTAWNLAGLTGEPASPKRLRAYLELARRDPRVETALRPAVRVRFYRAWYSVIPEEWRHPPRRAELLYELPLR